MKSINFALALMLCTAAALGGCTAAPYVDSRREAGQKDPVGASRPQLVAICYSRYSDKAKDAAALAESECAKIGRTATLDHEDRWDCTFVAPTRAYYRCVAKP